MSQRAVVVVLGDLARSPRMLNHAHALLELGWKVDLVGLGTTELPQRLREADGLQIHPISAASGRASRAAGLWSSIVRARRGASALTLVLSRLGPGVTRVLVQSPPAVHVLTALGVWARAQGAELVIDWHNLGWAILKSRGHRLASAVSKRLEIARAKALGDKHIAVTTEMAEYLSKEGIRARPMSDVPNRWLEWPETLGLEKSGAVICPMSWTGDDGLKLLRGALEGLPTEGTPETLILSGNGPRRREWLPRLEKSAPEWLDVRGADVAADDYPRLLASSSVGLSLHRSASGVDFPMKIVEMRAVGLPVMSFPVSAGPANVDRVFQSPSELASALQDAWAGSIRPNRDGEVRPRAAVLDGWTEGVKAALGA